MNARTFVAVAITASLLGFTAQTSQAAEGPLAHFAGTWSGNGKITVQNGTSERIRCRSNNTASGNALALSMRCASDSYTFNLGSDIAAEGANISGSWNETSRGVIGSLSGKISGSNITATATSVGVTAALSIRTSGNALTISIRSPGSEVSEVAVTMARGK
jgi:hypothetical protein